jgi:hypothetical protein
MNEENLQIYTPIICCKDSNYLLLIDTTLVKLLSSPNLPPTILPLILQTFPPNSFKTQDITLPNFLQFLEDEIITNFEIFRKYLVMASRATPFSMRKMSFLCRVLCEERRKKEGNPHYIWREFERAIEEVSAKGWLGKITGVVSAEGMREQA